MTNYNKQTLGTFFQTGDVPSGTDYQNLIDSQVNIVETSVQAMAGALSTTELITPRVSAANINVTGILSANNFSINSLTITTDVTAGGTVYASSMRTVVGTYQLPVIISAAGTAQAAGASLGVSGIIRCKGIVNDQTTGFLLLSNQTGLQQTIWIEENTSCNLWPCVGGQINALASNAAFPMAGNTQYIINHIKASGYSVK